MLFGVLPFAVSSAADGEYAFGDVIEFGSYPQTRVTDEALIAELNGLGDGAEWISYGYYSGNEEEGSMTPGDWMQYCDVAYNDSRYRGVYFTRYRPAYSYGGDTAPGSQIQFRNGYKTGTVYWFSWDPLRWIVLDPGEGLVMTENLIDARTFRDVVFTVDGAYYSDPGAVCFANDYETSFVRAWLNEEFSAAAFSAEEQTQIADTVLDNTAGRIDFPRQYDGATTADRIFLLSYCEYNELCVNLSAAGSENEDFRKARGTDYSMCQGVSSLNNTLTDTWMLRSPGRVSNGIQKVDYTGTSASGDGNVQSVTGVRPAFRFRTTALGATEYETREPTRQRLRRNQLFYIGSYPQSSVTDEALSAELETVSEQLPWQSFGYFDGEETSDFARYKDVEYRGGRFRAVLFSAYRAAMGGVAADPGDGSQYENGYFIDKVYWFRYEPIMWRVLDPDEGILLSSQILDSRPMVDRQYGSGNNAYGDPEHRFFANNYEQSDLRAWLTGAFFDSVFTDAEKVFLLPRELDNSEGPEVFRCNNTFDSVFLLSHREFQQAAEDVTWSKTQPCTDYANAQGVKHGSSSWKNCGDWFLRTPIGNSEDQEYVNSAGMAKPTFSRRADVGVVPAVSFSYDDYCSAYLPGSTLPTEPEENAAYEGLDLHFSDGILTVSGSGSLPAEPAEDSPLAQYAEDCTALILGDGIASVAGGAFGSLAKLETVVIGGDSGLESGAFASNGALRTVICSGSLRAEDGAFADDAEFSLYEEKTRPHAGTLPALCNVLPYSFAGGVLTVSGSVRMDTYDLLDLMTVMCGMYDDIRAVRFDAYTSEDLSFYTYNAQTGRYTLSHEKTLSGVSFSVAVASGDEWARITFNEFCALAAEKELESFRLVTETEGEETYRDTDMTLIERIQDGLRRVLKWVVGLLNKIFRFFAKLGK